MVKAMDKKNTFIQRHYWKIHAIIAFVLILLSFVGVLLTNFMSTVAWKYWNISIPIFALLCIGLNWADNQSRPYALKLLFQEVLHWSGILLTIYLVSVFVHYGLISNIDAGLFVLTLLALGTFMAGIYLNKTFYIISFIQALFVFSTIFFIKYLILISIILIVVFLVLLFWRARHTQKKDVVKTAEKISKDMD
jgi:nitrogen fixation-related uncharacterized protein